MSAEEGRTGKTQERYEVDLAYASNPRRCKMSCRGVLAIGEQLWRIERTGGRPAFTGFDWLVGVGICCASILVGAMLLYNIRGTFGSILRGSGIGLVAGGFLWRAWWQYRVGLTTRQAILPGHSSVVFSECGTMAAIQLTPGSWAVVRPHTQPEQIELMKALKKAFPANRQGTASIDPSGAINSVVSYVILFAILIVVLLVVMYATRS